MTPKQHLYYWRQWGAVRRSLVAKGWPAKRADLLRHELHRSAVGRDISSSDLSNQQLDLVLQEFRRISDGGDLDGLWELADQPAIRARHVASELAMQVADITSQEHLDAYLLGIAKRIAKTEGIDLSTATISKVPVSDLDDVTPEDWRKIIAALTYQLKRRQPQAPKRPKYTQPPPGSDDPF